MIAYLGARNRYRDERQKVLTKDRARGRREGDSVNEKIAYGQESD